MPFNFFNNNKIINFKAILTTFFATIITVGAGIWVTSLVGPVPISVTQTLTDKEQTFKASGEAELEVIPDQVEVRLGINLNRSTVVSAQNAANEVINSVTQALTDLGIEKDDIKTQNYNINPEYDYSRDERRITGYRVNTQLLVTLTDFSLLNEAIDVATGLGANQVGGVNFSLSKEKQEELRTEAREIAIKKAKESAKELAKLSGVKLGKVINVSESQPRNDFRPMYDTALMAAEGAGPEEPTQIQPGTETYNYNVTLSFETL